MSITYSRNAEVAGSVPSVNIATHNNRKKRYNSETNKPIYYLNKREQVWKRTKQSMKAK